MGTFARNGVDLKDISSLKSNNKLITLSLHYTTSKFPHFIIFIIIHFLDFFHLFLIYKRLCFFSSTDYRIKTK